MPLALVAGVGWWASRRGPSTAPNDGKPKLVFRVEQPTSLKAFDGVKSVVVASMTPDTTQFLRRTDYCVSGPVNPDVWIDMKTPQGIKTWNRNAKTAFAPDTFDEWLSCDYHLFMKQVPQGETTLRFKGAYVPSGVAFSKATSIPIQGSWTMDKSQVQPFDFSRPRLSEVELRSLTVSNVSKSGVDFTALFVLTGKGDGSKTAFDKQSTMSSDWIVLTSWSQLENNPKERAVTFGLSASGKRQGKMPKFTVVTGRASADNRWPLALQSEPFEFRKVKVGQKLKFKTWPAPLPPNANTK